MVLRVAGFKAQLRFRQRKMKTEAESYSRVQPHIVFVQIWILKDLILGHSQLDFVL